LRRVRRRARHHPLVQFVKLRVLKRAGPATVVDKPVYSAFFRSSLTDFLVEKHVRTVIVSGAETDVCVLSTVPDAVNIGFRVVIVEDATFGIRAE
jgi:nicotinamidase-related amidase